MRAHPLLVTLLALSCKGDPKLSKAEVEETRALIEQAEKKIAAMDSEWQAAMAKAIEARPQLGDPCEIELTALTPPSPMMIPMNSHAYASGTLMKPPSTSYLAVLARDAVKRANRDIEQELPYLTESISGLRQILSDEYWTHALALLWLETAVPSQEGGTDTVAGGSLAAAALLYSFADKRIVCEGAYTVGTGESADFTYTEFRAPGAGKAEADGRRLSATDKEFVVELDLQRKAFYSAPSHWRQVTGRE